MALSGIVSPREVDTIIGQWKRDVVAQRFQGYPEMALSISVGRAFFPGSSPSENEMSILRAADQEMYKDKARMKGG